ncbi:MAG TPA: pepsin/retropepsin-like aspartic protease family protein, partial [Thermoanaerobaculia bacterium]|nr:pepsin/retropepsin-like aspartic protease family protein [Thermoanaerobaculia bacterium]
EARVNGRGPYRLLVDTGANVTLLQGRVARELRLPVLRPGEKSQLVAVDRLEIGPAIFGGLVAGARDWREDIDGVLGFNLFSDCLLTFDYPARTLVLERGALSSANGGDRIPFEIGEGRHPFIVLDVGGSRMSFLLDTGAAQWLTIPSATAKGLRFDGPPVPGRTLTWNDRTYSVEVARLAGDVKLGAYVLRRPEVLLTPDEFPLIGSGFLKEFRLTIDQASKIIRLTRDSTEPIRGP